MKYSIILAAAFAVLLPCSMSAQEAAPLPLANEAASGSEETLFSRSSLGLSVGLNLGAYREQTYANAAQSIEAVSLNLHARIPAGPLLHSINLYWYPTEPDSALTSTAVLIEEYDPLSGEASNTAILREASVHRACMEYQLGWRLGGGERFPAWLGVNLRADLYMQFAHYPSITTALNLGPVYRQDWIINTDNRLSITLHSPLLGWVLRPPYAGADALMMRYAAESPLMILTMGGFSSLHNHLALNSDLVWTHRVNDSMALLFKGSLAISRFAEPRPRNDIEWAVNTGAVYQF